MWLPVLLPWLVISSTYAQNRLDLYEGEICNQKGGVNWLCTKLRDCVSAQEDIKNRRKVETCNFDVSTVIVCCEPKIVPQNVRPTFQNTAQPKPPPQVISQTRPTSTTPSKSRQMCRKYAESVYFKVQDLTGKTHSIDTCNLVEPLIVNGTVAQAREFPHMALIGMATRLGIKWNCGGSLISERFVLSAAHCNPGNPKRVRLGDYDIKSTKDDEDSKASPVELDIIEVIEHPEYDGDRQYNDITLYKLEKDVVFNEYIRPICLHTEYNLPPKGIGIISGWGKTSFSGRQSDVLLKGNVSYVPGQECAQLLNPSIKDRKAEVQDNMMVCAGNFVNGTDTCQGDSGGPLQYRLSDPYCMYNQVGITSFGVRCGYNEGEPKYPAVYTRVSNYVPWIESIVWP